MIFDNLDSLGKYKNISRLDSVLHFLKNNDPLKLPSGDIEIEGRELYVKVLDYMPAKTQENRFEAHRFHADIQIVFRGIESMRVTRWQNLSPVAPYDEKTDAQFFTTPNGFSDLRVQADEFTVFFPGELHQPGCWCADLKQSVRKLVFKIKQRN